jgi:alkanesulfonate monooxygenase SsuD/methylene tetrahydromethanopterin reductase-like flavin-dependent oxidoreductase (luciferase family)
MELSFGIKTTPMRIDYRRIVDIWREADGIPEIGHAWLWDHFLPLRGPATDPVHESWTLLAALAAQTTRLQLGVMVTSNAARPPAVLGKMAATVDQISDGRLILGLGVGGTRQPADIPNPAVREYAAYGLPLVSAGAGVARFAEACTIVRRLWSGEVFDFAGQHYQLTQAVCQPPPVQRPGPPLLLAGWGDRTLAVIAEHADIWNIPGPPHGQIEFLVERSRRLDEKCEAIGRDPATLVRSVQMIVSADDAASCRAAISELTSAGFSHFVLAPALPDPTGAARWLADEIIRPARAAGTPIRESATPR